MAVLGESCSHVTAALFYIEYAARLQETKTVTLGKAYWMPSVLKEGGYSEIKDIDFMSSKSIKRKMELRLRDASKPYPSTSSCSNQNSSASDQELDNFIANLDS